MILTILTIISEFLADLPLIGKAIAAFMPTAGQKADQPITDAANAISSSNANPGDTSAIEKGFNK